jgi:hypothetical protein
VANGRRNGGRHYLADEVMDQRKELTALGKQVAEAGLTAATLLAEHETERQQLVGAGKVIAQIGRMGWVIVGAVFAGGIVVVGWIAALFTTGLPGK